MEHMEKREFLLREILQNTKSQSKAIEEDNLEVLATLIDQRDSLMQQVDNLPVYKSESIKEILSEIVNIDNTNQALMNKEFEHIKSELRKIRIGKQQEQNYRNEYGTYREEGVFFDTK